MKITLITACFNNETTIGKSLQSVALQTYTNIEHIIVDGASTDKTVEIIKSHISDFTSHTNLSASQVSYQFLSEPDKGMYYAINKGLSLATGDIVGLLHSDDELYNVDTIEMIANHFQQSNADWLYGNGIYVDIKNSDHVIRNWISNPLKKWKLWLGWVPLHTTMYFTKEAINQLGFYNTRYRIASDYEYTLRALKKTALKVHYTGLYHVRMNMGGTSTSLKYQLPKSQEDFLIMLRNGLPAPFTLFCKIIRKIPQFLNK